MGGREENPKGSTSGSLRRPLVASIADRLTSKAKGPRSRPEGRQEGETKQRPISDAATKKAASDTKRRLAGIATVSPGPRVIGSHEQHTQFGVFQRRQSSQQVHENSAESVLKTRRSIWRAGSEVQPLRENNQQPSLSIGMNQQSRGGRVMKNTREDGASTKLKEMTQRSTPLNDRKGRTQGQQRERPRSKIRDSDDPPTLKRPIATTLSKVRDNSGKLPAPRAQYDQIHPVTSRPSGERASLPLRRPEPPQSRSRLPLSLSGSSSHLGRNIHDKKGKIPLTNLSLEVSPDARRNSKPPQSCHDRSRQTIRSIPVRHCREPVHGLASRTPAPSSPPQNLGLQQVLKMTPGSQGVTSRLAAQIPPTLMKNTTTKPIPSNSKPRFAKTESNHKHPRAHHKPTHHKVVHEPVNMNDPKKHEDDIKSPSLIERRHPDYNGGVVVDEGSLGSGNEGSSSWKSTNMTRWVAIVVTMKMLERIRRMSMIFKSICTENTWLQAKKTMMAMLSLPWKMATTLKGLGTTLAILTALAVMIKMLRVLMGSTEMVKALVTKTKTIKK
ncbi:uncharacterized protein BCR38DRAFT_415830 [Pseudomassariella vexata]|uniref:Uncharacterized protein n=1 Tax=Pseudomassariella vexata TaxID=1141098 RepID=A0A1Y2EHL6_9PEZI|nr:uncharacterized protein BCR38DRAFT_415830 [Pseudomassariella vexata]ORY71061.1 hypothetical protein BCR38DRAFT_415830 [Pseudomassariella vexata]